MTTPIRIKFIHTDTSIYYSIGTEHPHFVLVDEGADAEVIVFENHSSKEIRNNAEFKAWPEKCIIINAEDSPSYFLPGCYASNHKTFLNQGRGRTIPYMRMQREGPNRFISVFSNHPHKYLYAFRGGATSWLRKRLFKMLPRLADNFIAESNTYYHWSIDEDYKATKADLQKEYANLLMESLFFLCPRGAGSSSIRLFEVMEAGRVPVIISDDWIPVAGFNWDEFSIRVAEKDIEEIDSIIRANESRAPQLSAKAAEIFNNNFAAGPDLVLLANAIRSIQLTRNENRERMIRSLFPIIEGVGTLKQKAFKTTKYLVLKAFQLSGRKFPYSLNRPLEEQVSKR